MKRFHLFLLVVSVSLLASSTLFAQWEPDQRLTFNPPTDSSLTRSYYSRINGAWLTCNSSCVAAGPGGVVHVVWFDNRNNDTSPMNWEIYYKRSTNSGVSWSPDRRLTFGDSVSQFPSIAVSGSNVHVVWQENGNGSLYGLQDIFYKRSTDAGVTWSSDIQLTNNSGTSANASVAVSGANVHVVWEDDSYSIRSIYYKRSTDSGVSWSPDTCVIRMGDGSASQFATVAVSGNNVYVACTGYSGYIDIWGRGSTDGGVTWGALTRLTNDLYTSYWPSVAVSGSTVHLAWVNQIFDPGTSYHTYYRRSTDLGLTWSPWDSLSPLFRNFWYPNIAVSGSKVHLTCDAASAIGYKRSTDSGVSWEGDITWSHTESSRIASVAASDSVVHLVWYDERNGTPEIFYKRNPTGNTSGVEENSGVSGQGLEVRLKAMPNPFILFAAIPGHEQERFALYDISGRKVGTYKGDRIGEGLAPGVYFLRPEDRDAKPVRIVKLR